MAKIQEYPLKEKIIQEFPIEDRKIQEFPIEEFPVEDTQITPRRTPWQTVTTPISKLLTGKSILERTQTAERRRREMTEFATQRAIAGRPVSVGELMLRGAPSALAESVIDLADVSPFDVGAIATLPVAGKAIGKIPFRGIPIGEIASRIPLNKRFFKNIDEYARYQNTLRQITPFSSRGVIKAIPPKIQTPDFAENINLTKYPQDVRQTISDIVTQKPELGRTPTISDKELIDRAAQLKDTPTIKHLATLPEGTVEAEALKLRQGNVESIRNVLAGELGNLKNQLDDVIEKGIGLHRKTATMFGRGLRQQRLPAEAQQQMAFAIDNTIKKISKDAIFSKDKELLNTVRKLREMVVDKEFNPSMWNKVYFTWLNSILSNPFTHLVNTASNTFFALAKIPEKFASAIWDLPISKITGRRTQFFGEIPAMARGTLSRQPLPQGIVTGTKLDIMTTPIQGKLGRFIGTPTRLLQYEDDLAKGIVGRMELYAQKYAGKTGEELTKAVNLEQLYRTFQNDTGAIAEGLMFLRSKIPALRYIVPFIRTPANLIARGLERTPLVIAKIIHKGRLGQYTQKTLTQDLGLLTLGTVGAGWIGLQWAKGNVTGRVPKDLAQRDAFYRQGKKPNAIRIGNNWIPLERLEPLGTSFSVMANLIQDYYQSGREAPPDRIMEAFTKLGATLINKTYLSGFTNMVNALSDPEMYGKGFLSRIASGAVPQLLKFFADLKDPYYREANTVLDYLKYKIPFLSEKLPPKLNVFGEPVKRDFLNIGRIPTGREGSMEEMLKETPIGFPGKVLGGEKLIPDEYRWLLQSSGKELKKRLLKIDPDKFNRLPPEIKEEAIDMLRRETTKIPREILRMLRKKNKFSE